MKKAFVIVTSVILISILTLGACTQPTSMPTTKLAPTTAPATTQVSATTIELKFSTPGGDNTPINLVLKNALDEIKQRTNGRVTFKLYFGGALHAAGTVFEAVLAGGADVGEDQPSYNKGRFPVIEILEQPWGYPSAIVANKIAWDAFKKFQPAELKGFNVLFLASYGHPVIMSNKPVRTLSDMKGLKLRGTGNMALMIQTLGGAAVSMPIFETYDALRKGTVDGAVTGPENYATYKFYEVVKYSTDISFIADNMITAILMNLNKFNSLPPEIQQIFNEVGEKYTLIMAQTKEDVNLGGVDFAKQHGVDIITIPAAEQPTWQAATQTLTSKFVADSAAKGIPAQDIANFIQDAIKKAAK